MVYELLMTGEENATTAKQLARMTGLPTRAISLWVERERREGKAICATCNGRNPGYYLPATRAEMQAYCRTLQHREREIAKTRHACARTLQSLPDAPAAPPAMGSDAARAMDT